MAELDIPPEFLRNLILKVRALMANQGQDLPSAGLEQDAVFASIPGDMLRAEVIEEISALDREHMHELVALMWIGRGDFSAEEWEEAISLAEDRHEGPVAKYLLDHPHVADHWLDALDKIYNGSELLETGGY